MEYLNIIIDFWKLIPPAYQLIIVFVLICSFAVWIILSILAAGLNADLRAQRAAGVSPKLSEIRWAAILNAIAINPDKFKEAISWWKKGSAPINPNTELIILNDRIKKLNEQIAKSKEKENF